MNYPVRVRSTRKSLDEFSEAEYGLYEDNQSDPDKVLVVRILERRPSPAVMELRTPEEVVHVYWAACSGTWSRYCWRAACNLTDRLRALVMEIDPEMVRRNPGPWDSGQA